MDSEGEIRALGLKLEFMLWWRHVTITVIAPALFRVVIEKPYYWAGVQIFGHMPLVLDAGFDLWRRTYWWNRNKKDSGR